MRGSRELDLPCVGKESSKGAGRRSLVSVVWETWRGVKTGTVSVSGWSLPWSGMEKDWRYSEEGFTTTIRSGGRNKQRSLQRVWILRVTK